MSKRYALNKADLAKILKGASIAGAGAVLTFLSAAITEIDFGEWSVLVVAGFSVLVNVLRKLLAGEAVD